MGELLGELFRIRDAAHLLHLLKADYKEHIILEEYYTELLKLIDSFIEKYLGFTNEKPYIIIKEQSSINLPSIEKFANDSMIHLDRLRDNLIDPFLQNIVDEMLELTAGLLYKIKFL